MFILVVAPAIIWINKFLNNNCISNYYLRCNNKKVIFKIFKESYIYIVPILGAFLLFFIYGVIKTNVNVSEVIADTIFWNLKTLKYPVLFLMIYLWQMFLYLGTYVNMGLIVSRKNRHYFISLFSSYLLFIGIELGLEIIFQKFLHFKFGILMNLMNIFASNDMYGFVSMFLFPLIIFIVTTILVIMMYKDKEKLLILCDEKN